MLRIRSTAAVAGLVPVLAVTGAGVPALARQAAPGPISVRRYERSAQSRVRPAFRVVVSNHFGNPENASGYSAIVVSGKRQAWAFGGTNPGGPSTPVAERWDGASMTPSALPPGLTGFISEASAPSPTDIWVASEYGGYVLHWNGTQWQLALRRSGDTITGLTAISPDDVWVFGAVAAGNRTGTWHFNGRTWRAVTGRAAPVYRASAISGSDIWAIAVGAKADSVLRYSGRTWQRVSTGSVLDGVAVSDILAISKRNVWILGDEAAAGAARLVLAHWNGTRWSRLAPGPRAFPGHLSAGPHGTVLATATPAEATAAGLIIQADSAGWRHVTAVQSGFGSGVSAVAVRPGTLSVLASGGVLTRLGGDAVIWEGQLARVTRHRSYDAD
ncbi:MAG TPA: hypothetical protein VMB74_16500 [Streptosporangiaceae bacterium]|nr:hypothetical protein [Streptosporangiaceae bacterium]